MRTIGIVLICLSVLGFILAIISDFVGQIMVVGPMGFSLGSTNLALIAIALAMYFKGVGQEKTE